MWNDHNARQFDPHFRNFVSSPVSVRYLLPVQFAGPLVRTDTDSVHKTGEEKMSANSVRASRAGMRNRVQPKSIRKRNFAIDALEPRKLLTANINGAVFVDANGNGVRHAGEVG